MNNRLLCPTLFVLILMASPSAAEDVWKTYTTADSLPDDRITALAIAPEGEVWFGTRNSTVVRLIPENGETWETFVIPADCSFTVNGLAVSPEGCVWASGSRGVFCLKENSWTSYGTSSGLPSNDVRFIGIAPDSTVWVSTNAGVACFRNGAWMPVLRGGTALSPGPIAFSSDGGVWFAGKDSLSAHPVLAVYKNSVWDTLAVVESFSPVTAMAVDTENVVWFVSGGTVYTFDGTTVSDDRGLPEVVLTGYYQGPYFKTLVCAPDSSIWCGVFYGGSDYGGIFRYHAGVWTRYSMMDGLVSNEVNTLAVGIDGAVWTGTDEGLSYFTSVFPIPLNTGSDEDTPVAFSSVENSPNPFNPRTDISFTIPAPGTVTLTVYDLTGRKVATPVNGRMGAGKHSIVFDGAALASGVYFYRLDSPGVRKTGKMTLLK